MEDRELNPSPLLPRILEYTPVLLLQMQSLSSDPASTLRLKSPDLNPPPSDPGVQTKHSNRNSLLLGLSDSGFHFLPSDFGPGSGPSLSDKDVLSKTLGPRFQLPPSDPSPSILVRGSVHCTSGPPLVLPSIQLPPLLERLQVQLHRSEVRAEGGAVGGAS